MKYCFPLSFCPFVRLVNVGKADSSFAIFLFFIYYMPRLLPLFQTFISAVFYSFILLCPILLCLLSKEERGIGIKKTIIKPLNTDYFLQKFDFRDKVVSLWSREVCFFSGSSC